MCMTKAQAVPAAEFARNFGRYRMLAQKGAVPVTSHGHITGYFVPPDEYEEFERFRARRRTFATVDLPHDKVRAIVATRMDPRHDHLDAMLDPDDAK
jgi:hypothetical protein